MDTGTVHRARFAEEVRALRRHVWVRALLGPQRRGRAPLYSAHIVVGPAPPNWARAVWRYEQCTFVAVTTTTRRLADAVDPAGAGELLLGASCATFALGPGEIYQWRRDPSLARFEELGIPWPTMHYELQLAGLENTRLHDPLIGRDPSSPSFPVAGAAFNAFFFNNPVVRGSMSPTLGRIQLRVVDTRARFRRVRERATGLDVSIGGHAVKGATLELNGTTYRRRGRIAQAGNVSWPLPPGGMDDAWLWIKRGSNWLDYRAPRGWGGNSTPDVEIEVAQPEDPVAEISALASHGEGQYLEYKEGLPAPGGDTTRAAQEAKRTAFKDIVAFANGGGGRVLYGVTDQGEIVGLDGQVAKVRDRLSEFVRGRVFPSPPHRILPRVVDGKLVLVR